MLQFAVEIFSIHFQGKNNNLKLSKTVACQLKTFKFDKEMMIIDLDPFSKYELLEKLQIGIKKFKSGCN